MPTRNDLTEALPQLQEAESQLHEYATNVLGIDYRIADYGALRTLDDTTEILGFRQADYAAAVRANPALANTPINTWRPIAQFGTSWHNYGAAFDVLITDAGGFESATTALNALKNVASQFGLRSSVPNDPPHFELPVSLSAARQMWIDYNNGSTVGIPNVPDGGGDIAAISTVAIIAAMAVAFRYFRK